SSLHNFTVGDYGMGAKGVNAKIMQNLLQARFIQKQRINPFISKLELTSTGKAFKCVNNIIAAPQVENTSKIVRLSVSLNAHGVTINSSEYTYKKTSSNIVIEKQSGFGGNTTRIKVTDVMQPFSVIRDDL